MKTLKKYFYFSVDHVLLCLTSDELSNVDSLELKIAELPEILLTGGKNNLATYVLKQNETKLLENSNSQQLLGATMFKIQGESESEEIPGFCGGKISHLKISSKCFQWLNETWIEMESLKSPRYVHQSGVNSFLKKHPFCHPPMINITKYFQLKNYFWTVHEHLVKLGS